MRLIQNIMYVPATWLCAQLTNIITIKPITTPHQRGPQSKLNTITLNLHKQKLLALFGTAYPVHNPACTLCVQSKKPCFAHYARQIIWKGSLVFALSVVGRAHILFN